MFECITHSKCAVAYLDFKSRLANYTLILVFSVSAKHCASYIRNDSTVTQMCTPGDDTILIAGTVHGSVCYMI